MYSRILVCGGRGFEDNKFFQETIEEAHKLFAPKFCIIEGGANGADRFARIWAKINGYPFMTFPANWAYFGYGAGAIRNTSMLDFGLPDLVVALPGGKGTRNMVEQSKARGIRIFPE